MSTHEGKKIVAAIDEFNASSFLSFGPLSMMSMALRTGRITDRHIQKFKQEFEEQSKKLPQSFFPYDKDNIRTLKDVENTKAAPQPVNRKERKALQKTEGLAVSVGYMEVNRDADGTILHDQYTPALISYGILPFNFNASHNFIPVSFNSRYSSLRFIQSTADPLNYKSPEFLDCLMWGTVMMQALGNKFHLENPGPVPMFIPHSKGLFLGYAEGVPEDTFRRTQLQKMIMSNRVRDIVEKTPPQHQPFVPTARAVVKTFFSESELHHQQHIIWKKLMKLQDDPEVQEGFELAFITHIGSAASLSEEDHKKVETLFGKIRGIMDTREWRYAARSSREGGHIPEESLYTKLKKRQESGLTSTTPKAQLMP